MIVQQPNTLLVDREVTGATAATLAEELGLSIVERPPEEGLYLHLTANYLALTAAGGSTKSPTQLFVDFTGARTLYRSRNLNEELLVRAARVQKKIPKTVIDTTGGLGRDAFLLASAGCNVDICERNMFTAALLRDGLQRAAGCASTADAASRMRLHMIDAADFLQHQDCSSAVVYLDPMFPVRKKSALVKQDIRLLQLLEGYSLDEAVLFRAAIESRAKKVIVKRPAKAGFLLEIRPAYSLTGKAVRFDVYLPSSQAACKRSISVTG